jgi:hypothetical protein
MRRSDFSFFVFAFSDTPVNHISCLHTPNLDGSDKLRTSAAHLFACKFQTHKGNQAAIATTQNNVSMRQRNPLKDMHAHAKMDNTTRSGRLLFNEL